MKGIRLRTSRTQVGLEFLAPLIVLEPRARLVSTETLRSVLTQTGRKGKWIRRLSATAVVWLASAIGN